MNALIDFLRSKGSLDGKELKKLYRILSKRVHPDSGGEAEEAFIRLREEYLEALALLGKKTEAPSPAQERHGAAQHAKRDYSLVFMAFSLVGQRNFPRYYEMALYLMREYAEGAVEDYKRVFAILRRKGDKRSGALARAIASAAAIARDNKYRPDLRHERIFRTYYEEIQALAPEFGAQDGEAVMRVADWLEGESRKPY